MSRVRSSKAQGGLPVGIEARHSRECQGSPCTCEPSYRAWVSDRRTKKLIRRSFSGKGALAAAKRWRTDAQSELQRGVMVAPTGTTLRQAAEQFIAGAKATPPTVLNRSGAPFKPSVLRGYEHDLNVYVLPVLGIEKLSEIRRGDLQRIVGSKVRNIVTVVKSVYRWALDRELVGANPTAQLRLPNGVKHRERAASREELAELLGSLPLDMRAVYATAAFSGLRRGELRGLKWSDVDFEARRISVVRSWDDYEGEITPKSKAATRLASMPRVLASSLAEHKLAREKAAQPDHFVFSSNGGETVFTPPNVRERALVAWKNANLERPITKQLNPIGLHECRHSFVSLAFAAGVRRETVQGWVGHSSQSVTDIYRHTRPEVFDAELALLDDYLSKTKLATPPLVLSSTNGVGG